MLKSSGAAPHSYRNDNPEIFSLKRLSIRILHISASEAIGITMYFLNIFFTILIKKTASTTYLHRPETTAVYHIKSVPLNPGQSLPAAVSAVWIDIKGNSKERGRSRRGTAS